MNVTVHSKLSTTTLRIKRDKVVAPCMQSTREDAWSWIRKTWYTPVWTPCPEWVKVELKLHPQMGICSGNLVTKVGDMGMTSFCHRVNHKKEN